MCMNAYFPNVVIGFNTEFKEVKENIGNIPGLQVELLTNILDEIKYDYLDISVELNSNLTNATFSKPHKSIH